MKTLVLTLALVLTATTAAPGQVPDQGRVDDRGPVDAEGVPMFADVEPAGPARPRDHATGLVFAQSVPRRSRDAMRRALGSLRAGDEVKAVALLREAVAGFAEYFDANLLLGVVDVSGGRFAEAESALSVAIRVNDRDPRAHFYRGVALVGLSDADRDPALRTARLEAAGRELDRASDLGGATFAVAHLQRGRVYERMGDRAAAANSVERYLRLEPGAPNAAALQAAIAKLRAR